MPNKKRIKKLEQEYERLADKLNEVIKEHNRVISKLDIFTKAMMVDIQKYEK